MLQLLSESSLLLLFLVLAVGAPLGKIKIAGVNLGIASILFTGLAFGALAPNIKLPAIVYEIGLVLFIYCIGVSSGEQFFGNLKKKGWKENVLTFGAIILVFLMVVLIGTLSSIKSSYLAGIFAGSLTNTPSLAASLEFIKASAPVALIESALAEPVVAYSVCYPMGVIGMILAIILFQKIFKTSLKANAQLTDAEKLTNATVVVSNDKVIGSTITELKTAYGLTVVFGRIKRGAISFLALDSMSLERGDLMTIVGKPPQIEKALSLLGTRSENNLEMDHQQLDVRRIFVSNLDLVGQSLKDLNLPHTMGIIITRIRRGDSDILPNAETTLQFGDRVRVLTGRNELAQASKFFGDSYAAQSEIDILTLGLGVAAGFFLGMIPITLPGGIILKLGIAGGPLIVALLLGSVNRIGKLVFVMPYSANNTIRQLGLVLFLAGVGTRSGYAFRETMTQSDQGINFFLIGAAITIAIGFLFLFVGHRFLRIPFPRLAGMLAGFQTQPAVLAFVNEQAKSEQPNIGYSSVFPIATLTKIIFVQILLTLLA
ncbi:MAG: transporter [Cytophagales bacterium]|jgi:putative transport protein|nr:transporter [Cytophagales bacterium]MCA6388982.1 transporter [Cytophagales bacterium]MCA6393464.1 transporter [Cytophagales bacterium]MCA6395440.1 transporter [Cytophagales bacterium]MCA6399484.1 transporter [Cytophagales bacterium]